MTVLPSGTITFLFTDIEGSTRLWDQDAGAMRNAVARHEELAGEIIPRHGGSLVKSRGEGDSLFAVFILASDAVSAALALQQAFRSESWPTALPLRVRMALHIGEAELRENDYFGDSINRCARLRAIGHGGQTLLSQTLRSVLNESLPANASLRDLGVHRLKDLKRSERVYQLDHPGMESEFPPLRSLNDLLHNLPLQLTSFVGREEEIREIKRLLRPKQIGGSSTPFDTASTPRLVTLMGVGGAGKTRLALQVAAELIEEYEHGVRLVELAALPAHSELVAQTVAATLGVTETAGREIEDLLMEFLKPRSFLIVLDNCEHVASACARLAEHLLLSCPGLSILATSRKALQSRGETTWRIPTLSFPKTGALLSLEETARIQAVRLFVERARTAKPHFELSEGNVQEVARICRRLDGMPFGIELAAAKINLLSIRQIAARLDKNFHDLKGGSVTTDKRHRTLTALIDWSYDLLQPPEQTLLRRLSVFVGGWTLEAAEAVCVETDEEFDVLEALSRLEQSSLLLVEEQTASNRFRLLETIRQYAADRHLATESAEELRARHLAYFVRLAEQAEPYLTRKEQGEWKRTLDADHDNFRAALSSSEDPQQRLRLAGALWRFWSMQGYISEGLHWLKDALSDCRDGSPQIRAGALNGLGVLAVQQNDHTTAQTALEESLALYIGLGNQKGIAEALSGKGRLALGLSRHADARSLFEQSLERYRSVGDLWGVGANLNNLGIVARTMGDHSAVKTFYEESLTLYRSLGDLAKVASVAGNLGILAMDRKDYVEAHPRFEESLKTFRQLNDAVGIATTLHNLGAAVLMLVGHAKAFPLFRESLLCKRVIGNRASMALTLFSIGIVYRDTAQFEQAARLFGCAETAWSDAGMVLSEEDQQLFQDEIEPVRVNLSHDDFLAFWTAGTKIPLEEAVEAVIRRGPVDNEAALC